MPRRLGELLVEEGRITPVELQEALRAQRIFGGSLGTHLLQLGVIDEEDLGSALARVHALPAAARAELLAAPPAVRALLPSDFVLRHRAIPFRLENDELHLAMQNPADSLALHEAAFLTGYRVVPHVAPEAVLRDAISSFQRNVDPPSFRAVAATARGRAPLDVTTGPMSAAAAARRSAASPRGADPSRDTNPVVVTPGSPSRGRAAPRTDSSAEESPTAELHGPAAEGSGDGALAATGRRLAAARSRDEVLAIALDEISACLPRACVFAIRGREAILWRSRGLPRSPARPITIPLDESSVLAAPEGSAELRYGPVAMTASNQDLYMLLGGKIPRVALVVPIPVRQRTVLVLYGDDPDGTAPPPDFARTRRLAALLSWALEATILRGKILRESGA